jgi:hypothetical protein
MAQKPEKSKSKIPSKIMPLWVLLLKWMKKFIDEKIVELGLQQTDCFDSVLMTVTLTEFQWSEIRFQTYQWLGMHLDFVSRTKFFQCVYFMIERFCGPSLKGFEK